MDTIRRASLDDFHRIRLLLRSGRHIFADFGSEDLATLLNRGLVMLGEEQGRIWGALLLQRLAHADALPPEEAERAMVRGLLLNGGRSPVVDVPALVAAAEREMEGEARLQTAVYATAEWTVKPLTDADFVLEDRLLFLELPGLQDRVLQPIEAPATGVRLRPGRPDEMGGLARLDAAAFTPLWHLDERELMSLLLVGRLQVAEYEDRLIGYTALSMQGNGIAHLARLAVHPTAQGLGVGRTLLHDAVLFARQELAASVMLNTQGRNVRARALYEAYGFRPAGRVVPVLTRQFGSHPR